MKLHSFSFHADFKLWFEYQTEVINLLGLLWAEGFTISNLPNVPIAIFHCPVSPPPSLQTPPFIFPVSLPPFTQMKGSIHVLINLLELQIQSRSQIRAVLKALAPGSDPFCSKPYLARDSCTGTPARSHGVLADLF